MATTEPTAETRAAKRREYQREWREKNREKLKEYHRQYHAEHRAEAIDRVKHYREEHGRFDNPITKRRNRTKYYAANKDRIIEHQRLSKAHRHGQYKTRCRLKSIEWALTKEQAYQLFDGVCEYCGSDPTPMNGIDRVDNNRGYTTDNVVSACKKCNLMKLTMIQDIFIAHCKKIAEWSATKKK